MYRRFSSTKKHGDPSKARFIKFDRLVGIEVEATGGSVKKASEAIDKACGISDDGSVTHPSIEVQTPPASADRLEYYIKNTTEGLRKAGFTVDRTCGLHIHIDGKGFVDEPENSNKLVATYFALEPLLHSMLPSTRRRNRFCRPLTSKMNKTLFRKLANNPIQKDKYLFEKKWYNTYLNEQVDRMKGGRGWDRYYGFNFGSLFGQGHLELRYHHGTINGSKIRNWIRLNLFIMNWVLNGYNKHALIHIDRCRSIKKKKELFYKYFAVPLRIRRYVDSTIEKFDTKK